MLRATECLRADCLGLRPIAARALSMFSGVSTVLTLPSGFLFVAEAVVRYLCTQFLIVLRSGTVPCLPTLQCRQNICRVGITEFLKNVCKANARCTADHRSMFTKWRP
jgi:hypothetical protein